MNIYLDDDRVTPDGYVRTYTVENTIDLIIKNNGTADAEILPKKEAKLASFIFIIKLPDR